MQAIKRAQVFESLDLFNSKYSCKTCKSKLRTKADQMIHHYYIHNIDLSSPLIVNCLYCNLKFTSFYKLKLHLNRLHFQERPYGCKPCRLKFMSFKAFKKHYIDTHRHDNHIYDLLKYDNGKDSAINYKIKIICNLKCLRCNFCSNHYINVPQFINHLREHIDNNGFFNKNCPDTQCNFVGNTTKHLIRHIENDHFDSEQYFNSILKCGIHNIEIDNLHGFKRHLYKSHNYSKSILLTLNNYIQSFVCEICNFESNNFNDLKKHSYELHSQAYLDHICTECDNVFPTEESLNFHSLQHNAKKIENELILKQNEIEQDVIPKNQSEECDLCGLKFPSRTMCANHKVLHQSSNPKRPYKCHLCIVSFSKANQLLRHMITHQKHGSDFSCEICFSTFSRKQDLERHMNFHLTN